MVVAAVAVIAVLIIVGKEYFSRFTTEEVRGDSNLRYTYDTMTEHNGQKYRLRDGITTILVMGIDYGGEKSTSKYRSGGQSDFLRLVIFDDENDTIHQIAIDRDTIAKITILGVLGNVSGYRQDHISLSHSFGTGGQDSAELTVWAVENLLGITIDNYAAIGLDGVGPFNAALGGVTVTVEDDFTSLDPALASGATVTLDDDQAVLFVRGRMEIGDGKNASRMRRQKEFMRQAAKKAMDLIAENNNFANTLYTALEPYLVTDMAKGLIVNKAAAVTKYTLQEEQSLPGEYQTGVDGYTEFHLDEDAAKQMILDICYVPLNG